jgi:hypothetical protein
MHTGPGRPHRLRLSGAGVTALLWVLGAPSAVHAQNVTVGTASGNPGTQVTFPVILQTPGDPFNYAGVAARIAYDPVNTPIAAAADGTPDCTVNPAIQKVGGFAFWPAGCTGAGCQQLRAVIYYSTDEGTPAPIANGAVLFTCTANLSPAAPGGVYPLIISQTAGSTPASVFIVTTGSDGSLTVNGGGCS